MFDIDYKFSIGNWKVDSAGDSHTELVGLETLRTLYSPGEHLKIALHTPVAGAAESTPVGLAAGALSLAGGAGPSAFSVDIRGTAVGYGDPITIDLTSGDQSARVMTAEVQCVDSSLGRIIVTGTTGMQRLARTRLNRVYENQSLSQIVADLTADAGVAIGEVDTGGTYAYFIVQDSKSLFVQIRELALREGLDFYFDAENKLVLKRFNRQSADHIFRYGKEILDLKHSNQNSPVGHVLVYGESPASSRGPDCWHWIARDISSATGEAGSDNWSLPIHDGAIRSKEAALSFAEAKLASMTDRSVWGKLKVLGNPNVMLGEAIRIENPVSPETNGTFKVTSVRHCLNKREGFVTTVGFNGIGGASATGGFMGGSVQGAAAMAGGLF